MSTDTEILVVEDDDTIRFLCETLLQKESYRVNVAKTVAEARIMLEKTRYDLIILDLNLPDGDGLDLTRRSSPTHPLPPFIIMSARDTALDRYLGFEAGATDYLIKPFHPGELIYRVRNLLPKTNSLPKSLLPLGANQLDLDRQILFDQAGTPIKLTRGEFNMLATLVRANGRPVNRDSLLDSIVQEGDGNPKTVDVLISRLRKKIEPDPRRPCHIYTVPGMGYRFSP